MAWITALYGRAEALLGARVFKIVRYLISGGIATVSNLAILFLLVHFGHIHYLQASILAFAASVAVSFTLQKFWTFQDAPMHDMHTQFARYLAVVLANLALNTLLIYLLVELGELWYLAAQALASVVVAIVGYFGYRHFVFRNRPTPPTA